MSSQPSYTKRQTLDAKWVEEERTGLVTDPQQVVGKQVRRMLSSGRPIQSQSIIEPLVIDRGDRVDIFFNDGLLALTSPGRALSDAHMGQEVRIVNLVSNKTVTAVATGNGTVEVLR